MRKKLPDYLRKVLDEAGEKILSLSAKDILDAVEKNGYEQITRKLFYIDQSTEEIKACAAGQALLNLGVVEKDFLLELYREVARLEDRDPDWDSNDLWEEVSQFYADYFRAREDNIYTKIWVLNDPADYMDDNPINSPAEIAVKLRPLFSASE